MHKAKTRPSKATLHQISSVSGYVTSQSAPEQYHRRHVYLEVHLRREAFGVGMADDSVVDKMSEMQVDEGKKVIIQTASIKSLLV